RHSPDRFGASSSCSASLIRRTAAPPTRSSVPSPLTCDRGDRWRWCREVCRDGCSRASSVRCRLRDASGVEVGMSGQPRLNVEARAHLAVVLLETTPATVAEVAALVRVSESKVYRSWYAAHPDRPPRGRRITEAMRAAQIEPFAALCDVMAAQLTDRQQRAAQIFTATRAMHGEV